MIITSITGHKTKFPLIQHIRFKQLSGGTFEAQITPPETVCSGCWHEIEVSCEEAHRICRVAGHLVSDVYELLLRMEREGWCGKRDNARPI